MFRLSSSASAIASRMLFSGLVCAAGCGPETQTSSASAVAVGSSLEAGIEDGQTLTIRRAAGPARCVDVAWNSKSNGTPVIFWDCHDGVNQQWKYRNERLVTLQNKCLEPRNHALANGTKLHINDCTGDGTAQKWKFDGHKVMLVGTNKCLDVDHGNTANGGHLQIWDCSTSFNLNQAWQMDVEKIATPAAPQTPQAPAPDAPATEDKGVACRGLGTWDKKAQDFEAQVHSLINAARAKGADCHTQGKFPPRAPLALDNRMTCVARAFAKDMSDKQFFAHEGPDGMSPFERMTRGGMHWRAAAENIADGQQTPESVVNAWLQSDHHCADLMGNYALTGVGFFDYYWVQDFATEF